MVCDIGTSDFGFVSNIGFRISDLKEGRKMPLPIYPTEQGAPGDGSLIALYGGGTTEVVGGVVTLAQPVEAYSPLGAIVPSPQGLIGEPLSLTGVTIWLRG